MSSNVIDRAIDKASVIARVCVIARASVIARNEAIFTHVMLSAVEASVRLHSYRSFDDAQDDKVQRLLRRTSSQ